MLALNKEYVLFIKKHTRIYLWLYSHLETQSILPLCSVHLSMCELCNYTKIWGITLRLRLSGEFGLGFLPRLQCELKRTKKQLQQSFILFLNQIIANQLRKWKHPVSAVLITDIKIKSSYIHMLMMLNMDRQAH